MSLTTTSRKAPTTGHEHPLLPAEVQDEYRALGYWEGKVLYEFVRDWASREPDRPAIVGPKAASYGELWASAHALATSLRQRGLEEGDCLMAVLPTSWQGVVLEVAASIAGLLLVPRSGRVSPTLAINLVDQLDVKALVISADVLRRDGWKEAIDQLGFASDRILAVGEVTSDFERLEELLDGECSLQEVKPKALTPTIVLSTGGTTGLPKSIVHASEALVYACREFARATGFTELDTHVAIAPYGHAGGSVFEIYMPLIHGANILPVPSWHPPSAVDLIEEYGGTFFITMGTHMYDLLALGPEVASRLKSMRVATSGAGPDELFVRAEATLGFPVLRVYGFSECPGHAIGVLGEAPETRLKRDGVPFVGMEHRFDTAQFSDSRYEAAGGYECRGPNMFFGYAGQPDLTDEVVSADGFYAAGDLVGRDSDGYLSWLGRTKDIIRRGGIQIDPIELENLLNGHPAISEVVVIGVPDDRLGEQAAIVATQTVGTQCPDLQELCDYLIASGIARQSLPEQMYWTDAIGRTELGKFDRATVRKTILEKINA